MTDHVRLLDAFPELEERLDRDEAATAREALTAPVTEVPAGRWNPSREWTASPGHAGVLVVDGLAARGVLLGRATAAELVGPGDLLRPGDHDGDEAPLPFGVEWTVLDPVRLAILGPSVMAAVGRWPPIAAALVTKGVQRAHTLAFHLAVSHVRRVDMRLLALLWHMADRWGRVSPDGVVVPVRLTHETLGRIVGASRPPITTALRRLEADGRIGRRAGGGWVLHGDPPAEFLDLRPKRP